MPVCGLGVISEYARNFKPLPIEASLWLLNSLLMSSLLSELLYTVTIHVVRPSALRKFEPNPHC